MDHDLLSYYSRRAPEYDEIYAKPERQADLAALRTHLRDRLRGHRVLELAAGTGYWTHLVAPVAESILATDLSPQVLELARRRDYGDVRVDFARADAYDLSTVPGNFTAAWAGFFWSHVLRQDLPRFLTGLHQRLGPGARVVFVDNRYVPGSSTEVSHTDDAGNTYQLRRLKDGTERTVLKNFPDEDELRAAVEGRGTGVEVEVEVWEYYWCLSYRVD